MGEKKGWVQVDIYPEDFSDQAFTSYSLFVSGLHMGNETKEQKEMSPRTHVRFFFKKILLKYNRHIINFRCTC